MQSKYHSFIESLVSMFIGFVLSVLNLLIVLPLFNIDISLWVNLKISLCFTVITVIRIYIIRRWFTNITENDK